MSVGGGGGEEYEKEPEKMWKRIKGKKEKRIKGKIKLKS
jgi:hypothetical protein